MAPKRKADTATAIDPDKQYRVKDGQVGAAWPHVAATEHERENERCNAQ